MAEAREPMVSQPGDPAYGHESGLPAIRGAAHAGVPLIEVGVRRIAHSTLFLYHEPHLDHERVVGPSARMGRRVESLSDYELRLVPYPEATLMGTATYAHGMETIKPYRTALQLESGGNHWR
jgi:glycerophosphoryl diester phosphodiesterase